MGDYIGLRFKGIVKPEFRSKFEDIALSGYWEDSDDYVLARFGIENSRASFIPCGVLSYMPDCWETELNNETGFGVATDGFDRTYDERTGRWTFQCSLKDCTTIYNFFNIVPHFIESVEHAEIYYEQWIHSAKYELLDNEMVLVNDEFIKYC